MTLWSSWIGRWLADCEGLCPPRLAESQKSGVQVPPGSLYPILNF